MKRCEKKAEPKKFPKVGLGDTVVHAEHGDVYLVVAGMASGPILVCLEDGRFWHDTDLWATSVPSDWKKVTCFFTVEDE